MGGKPDWMYDAERKHHQDTLHIRWKDGCWTTLVKDLNTMKWLSAKINGIFPEVPEGCDEAICFDDDEMTIECDLSVRLYHDGVWSKPMKFCGTPVPFVRPAPGDVEVFDKHYVREVTSIAGNMKKFIYELEDKGDKDDN
jgi:hypothetical protein